MNSDVVIALSVCVVAALLEGVCAGTGVKAHMPESEVARLFPSSLGLVCNRSLLLCDYI